MNKGFLEYKCETGITDLEIQAMVDLEKNRSTQTELNYLCQYGKNKQEIITKMEEHIEKCRPCARVYWETKGNQQQTGIHNLI